MNLNFLKTFYLLAENLSFSATAQIQKTSQPAISRQIQLLEQNLGESLFLRTKRTVQLSEFGKDYYLKIAPLIEGLLNAHKIIDQENTKITLKGASVPEFGRFYAFPKIVKTLSQFDTTLHFELDKATSIIEKLNQGKIDFGIVQILPTNKSLIAHKIFKEKALLISNNKTNKSQLLNSNPIELIGYREEDQYTQKFLNANFTKNEIKKFKITQSVNGHDLQMMCVEKSQKMAVIPNSSFEKLAGDFKVIKIMESKSNDYIYFLYQDSLKLNKIKMKMIMTLIKILDSTKRPSPFYNQLI